MHKPEQSRGLVAPASLATLGHPPCEPLRGLCVCVCVRSVTQASRFSVRGSPCSAPVVHNGRIEDAAKAPTLSGGLCLYLSDTAHGPSTCFPLPSRLPWHAVNPPGGRACMPWSLGA